MPARLSVLSAFFPSELQMNFRRAICCVMAGLVAGSCMGHPITQFLDAVDGQKNISVLITLQVSGLLGSGLVLRSAAEILPVTTNGSISFKSRIRAGQSYAIAVDRYPVSPSQYCSVSMATGTAGNENLTLAVICTAGTAAGPLTGGNIIRPLNLTGNADLLLGQVFAGSLGASATTDGTGNSARFTDPMQLTTDGTYLYVLELGGNIRRTTISTREVTTLGNIGGSDNITTDGSYLYATNFSDCGIHKMRLSDLSVSTLAGGTFTCNFADASSGAAALFNHPVGITSDGSYLYIADYQNHRIRKVDPNSGATTTIAGTGAPGNGNGAGLSATFNIPHGIIYFQNKLYITELNNYDIRVLDLSSATNTVTTLTGGTSGNADGAPGVAQFMKLRNLAIDGVYLYATDEDTHSVRRIDLVSGYASTLSGSPTRTTTAIGTGGASGTAAFLDITGITSDGSYLYVTDTSDFIVRRIE